MNVTVYRCLKRWRFVKSYKTVMVFYGCYKWDYIFVVSLKKNSVKENHVASNDSSFRHVMSRDIFSRPDCHSWNSRYCNEFRCWVSILTANVSANDKQAYYTPSQKHTCVLQFICLDETNLSTWKGQIVPRLLR